MTVTDDQHADLRALEEAIRHANESAKRMHDSPAFYARAHEHLNRRLDEYEAAKA